MAVLFVPPLFQPLKNGSIVPGGKVYTYQAGTSTPKATYTDSSEGTPNANPVILDSEGVAILFLNGSYKFVIKDASDVDIRTIDNVTSFSTSATSIDSILPSQTGNGSKFLTTNGTNSSWGLVGYANISPSAIATSSEILAGTASKIVDAATLKASHPGEVVDRAYAELASASTTTASIPIDDTIPQIGEGVEVLIVAKTPLSTTNRWRVEFQVPVATSSAGANMAAAIFKDAVSDALFATCIQTTAAHDEAVLRGVFEFVPGTVSSTTIRLRIGTSAGTMTYNGATGSRLFGGVSKITLVVTEFIA